MVKVESSNISAVDFNEGLIVEYKSGVRYKYKDVPKELYEKLLQAESKGRFVNTEIKGHYEYERLVEAL